MFNKSLGNILSNFTKVSDELTTFMTRTEHTVTEKEKTISILEDEVISLNQDFYKAGAVLGKIKEILGE